MEETGEMKISSALSRQKRHRFSSSRRLSRSLVQSGVLVERKMSRHCRDSTEFPLPSSTDNTVAIPTEQDAIICRTMHLRIILVGNEIDAQFLL